MIGQLLIFFAVAALMLLVAFAIFFVRFQRMQEEMAKQLIHERTNHSRIVLDVRAKEARRLTEATSELQRKLDASQVQIVEKESALKAAVTDRDRLQERSQKLILERDKLAKQLDVEQQKVANLNESAKDAGDLMAQALIRLGISEGQEG